MLPIAHFYFNTSRTRHFSVWFELHLEAINYFVLDIIRVSSAWTTFACISCLRLNWVKLHSHSTQLQKITNSLLLLSFLKVHWAGQRVLGVKDRPKFLITLIFILLSWYLYLSTKIAKSHVSKILNTPFKIPAQMPKFTFMILIF